MTNENAFSPLIVLWLPLLLLGAALSLAGDGAIWLADKLAFLDKPTPTPTGLDVHVSA